MKWSGISSCRRVDSVRVGRAWFLYTSKLGETEDFAGILGTARRRHMTWGRTDKIRVPINTASITHCYYLSRIKYKSFIWWELGRGKTVEILFALCGVGFWRGRSGWCGTGAGSGGCGGKSWTPYR